MLRDAANFQVMEKIVHSDAKLFRAVLHHKGRISTCGANVPCRQDIKEQQNDTQAT